MFFQNSEPNLRFRHPVFEIENRQNPYYVQGYGQCSHRRPIPVQHPPKKRQKFTRYHDISQNRASNNNVQFNIDKIAPPAVASNFLEYQQTGRPQSLPGPQCFRPKTALQTLREMGVAVTSLECTYAENGRCTVHIIAHGVHFYSTGKNLKEAEAVAAEQAIKTCILKQLEKQTDPEMFTQLRNDEETDDFSPTFPWEALTNFSLYKLLRSFSEESDVNQTAKLEGKKAAKEMPVHKMTDPISLLYHRIPYTRFKEVREKGTPQDRLFVFKCMVGSATFFGSGRRKKEAKRKSAIEACRALLNIEYVPEMSAPLS